MTLDLDAGPWTTTTLAMARDVAAQGHMTIEVASMSPRPAPASLALALSVVIDRPVAAYAMWSGSTLVATCRPPGRREPVGVPMLLGGRRLANYLRTMVLETQTLARACGKSHVQNLEPEDLVAVTVEAAAMARVPLAGTNWIPGPPRDD